MVKGQCRIYFSLLSVALVYCGIWLELCSSASLPSSISAISLSSLLDLGPASFMFICAILSALFHTWPSLYLHLSATGRSFSLFFFVFLCSLLPFDKGVHDSLWGLFPLAFKCAKKKRSTDRFLQAVCVSNIRSLLLPSWNAIHYIDRILSVSADIPTVAEILLKIIPTLEEVSVFFVVVFFRGFFTTQRRWE